MTTHTESIEQAAARRVHDAVDALNDALTKAADEGLRVEVELMPMHYVGRQTPQTLCAAMVLQEVGRDR
jgi:hypothetical protein